MTVTVHDSTEELVQGATVTGQWTGYKGSPSCTTNVFGQCSIMRSRISTRQSSITFAVTNISAPGNYDSVANHDPDGDSFKGNITINQP